MFAADGSEHVTGGSLDLLQSVGTTNLPIVGGSYSIGTDLRGLLTLQTPQGTRSYKIALNPSGSARVIESDSTGTQASGVLKTQSASSLSNATLSGNFALG